MAIGRVRRRSSIPVVARRASRSRSRQQRGQGKKRGRSQSRGQRPAKRQGGGRGVFLGEDIFS